MLERFFRAHTRRLNLNKVLDLYAFNLHLYLQLVFLKLQYLLGSGIHKNPEMTYVV